MDDFPSKGKATVPNRTGEIPPSGMKRGATHTSRHTVASACWCKRVRTALKNSRTALPLTA